MEIKIEYPEIEMDEEGGENDLYPPAENGEKVPLHVMINHPNYNLWTSKATACLISQYKKYRHMVGQTTRFRSLRDMFETISVDMQKHGFYFSPQKCENKWRVLERKYKNLVIREMIKKPGRMKHYGHWEHKRALDEIFDENRKQVYLKESEYPTITSSTKYAIILPEAAAKAASNQTAASQKSTQNNEVIDPMITATTSSVQITTPNLDSLKLANAELLKELKEVLTAAEKSKERRHAEKMAMRQDELDIQKRLLKIKEQKIELKKREIIAMSNYVKSI
ncbi:uncharacterized protein LOC131668750 isoform X2 [Phymastichus coffea]|nr:uncharacterized protein LOC131668750 isoform X2 [Phymastichus coffea]XP_058799145.1 uncharacterized protein LOC131668750 isoform X2 [Phymastichus coffea]XP_058799146.1 uncharacterized protein LOC131668750 isoform X2 [Phymastichus coffea]